MRYSRFTISRIRKAALAEGEVAVIKLMDRIALIRDGSAVAEAGAYIGGIFNDALAIKVIRAQLAQLGFKLVKIKNDRYSLRKL